MRRVVVESTITELGRYLDGDSSIQKLELFEVLALLKEDPNEWALICRIKMKDPKDRFERIFGQQYSAIQRLQKEEDGQTIYFLQHKPSKLASGLFSGGGFMSIPLEIRNGRIRASFLGNPSGIQRILRTLNHEGLRYDVVSNTDAKFSMQSPLASLTEKQRRVITLAFNLGYYEIPKKVSSEELAKKLNIREATFARHRIKAERRVLKAVLEQS